MMRPAWLPPAPHERASSSPRNAKVSPPPIARPRSAALSSSSSSSSSPRDEMVHSARQLLQGARVDDGPAASLKDYMDSFPLVPLPVIPRLPLVDLIECETGLVKLYRSLAVDTNAEEAQLAKYVARQLGLVQRHLEQARARERVLKLLSGELPVRVNPITIPATVDTKKPLPVFLQPPVTTTPTTLAVAPPALAPAKSTGSSPQLAKRTEMVLAKAKAQAKLSATTQTAFVITMSETSLKARQKRKRVRKKTPEQLEQERIKRQEKEKEVRRQAAYQRLLARQEQQAKKKEEAQHKKQGPAMITTMNDATSDSEGSDVSNCSETDAADETAIMAMHVMATTHTEQTSGILGEEDGLAKEEAEEDTEEEEESDTDDHLRQHPNAEQVEISTTYEQDERHEEETVLCVKHEESPTQDATSDEFYPSLDPDTTASEESSAHQPHEQARPEVNEQDDDASLDHDDDTHLDKPSPPIPEESEAQRDQRTHADIAEQLQLFMTNRKQAALDDLQRQADERRGRESARIPPPPASSRLPTARPATPMTPAPSASFVQPPRYESAPRRRTSARSPQRQAAKVSNQSRNQLVPRPLGKDIKEYREYFANFFCILTSVFEQRVAITANTSTSSLLAPVPASGDQALRLQLKLYQSWQTIMTDYATVFGNSILTPQGLAPCSSSSTTAHYRINSQSRKEVSDIVVTALEKRGDWEEHPSGLGLKTTWNLLWTWSKPNVERKTLLAWQKVNHFQHAKHLTRKDCLKKSLTKYLALGGRLRQAFDIAPPSFLLPQEYIAFVQAFQERAKIVSPRKNIWIMKPVALSRGRGISLVNDLSDVVYSEPVVIQEYIANPLLLDGFKFDLRLYVLVTSFNPLEVFFYEDGFVRVCTRAYEDGDLGNLFVHLTNSSIQKENQDAITHDPENPIHNAQAQDAGGTKMTLAYLWQRLEAMGADVVTVKRDILSVVLKALMCGEDHIPFQVNSFDLYGYDILLDANFRPWLIEINSSPSMARENALDYQVKDALIYDTLRLVDPLHFDRTRLVEVLARRFQDAEQEKKRLHANTRHPRELEELAARQLNEDLTEILCARVPRAYGELPEYLGSFTRLAPHTTLHNQLVKLKKSCLRLDRK